MVASLYRAGFIPAGILREFQDSEIFFYIYPPSPGFAWRKGSVASEWSIAVISSL
jgi:hypothetical protein